MKSKAKKKTTELKFAYKTFKNWFKLLLETEQMDDSHDRRTYQSALLVLKRQSKQKKRI